MAGAPRWPPRSSSCPKPRMMVRRGLNSDVERSSSMDALTPCQDVLWMEREKAHMIEVRPDLSSAAPRPQMYFPSYVAFHGASSH